MKKNIKFFQAMQNITFTLRAAIIVLAAVFMFSLTACEFLLGEPAETPTPAEPTAVTSVSISIGAPANGGRPGTTASTNNTGYTLSEISWSPSVNWFLGGTVYTATVTLTANSGYTFTGLNSARINGQTATVSNNSGTTVRLSYTFPATPAKIATDIVIKTQPAKLVYTHGDLLDLAGLEVTLTYDDTTTEDVAAANFTAKSITTNPAQGDQLDYSIHNGQPVVITFGSLPSLNTGNLTVSPKPITNAEIIVIAPVKGATPETEADGTGNFTIGTVSWSPVNTPFLGGMVYTATVTLTADNGYTFDGLSSATINGQDATVSNNAGVDVTLSYTFSITDERTAIDITIKTQPTKLAYTHGETLDLTGLVVTLTYDDTTTEDVSAADIAARNITANPAHGNQLTHVIHNGQPVTIIYGGLTPLVSNNLTVNPKVITFTVDPILAQTYTGNPFTPTVTVRDGAKTLSPGADYTVMYTGNTNAGTATVNITGAGNYAGSIGSATFTIDPKVITFAVEPIPAQTYTGSSHTPTVTVMDGTTILTLNTDYTVEYADNINAGTATVTVTGAGNYAGSTGSTSFTINPKVITFEVEPIPAQTYTGNPFTPTVTVMDGTTILTLNTDYTVEYADNINAGTANITITGAGNYEGSTGSITFTILQTVSPERVEYFWVNQHGNLTTTSGGVVSVDVGQTLSITAQDNDDSFVRQWYLNGLNTGQSGNTYTFSSTMTGSNTVGLFVEKDGKLYNTNIIVTVINVLWARTVSTGTSFSRFNSVAVDVSGNIYAAGYQFGGTYTYGTGVTAQGDVVLVKYNANGDAQWARSTVTVSTGGTNSRFNSVAVDTSGNIYAAGSQSGPSIYTYGTGVTAQGNPGYGDNDDNVVLVKYNADGVAQWARTVSTGTGNSRFNSVTVDTSGNIYAAGSQSGPSIYTYGTGVTAQGNNGYGDNVVLVKYNADGVAQWARTVSTGTGNSRFNSVTVDTSGNIYAAGSQSGSGIYTYGTGVTAQGSNSDNNVVLVKYNADGVAQWARTVSTGTGVSEFSSVTVDIFGNIYAAGNQSGSGIYTYGTGITAQGSNTSMNVVLVKYNADGVAQWARTVSTGTGNSRFNSVTVDTSGNIYAAGYQFGGIYTYGTGVTAQGSSTDWNVVLVKYNANGVVQWARTVSTGTGGSVFSSVAVDTSSNIYVAGNQSGNDIYTYGTGVTAQGSSTDWNVVLVKLAQ